MVRERSLDLWIAAKTRFTPTERQRLFGLTIAIGGVCGLVAVVFHLTIRWFEGATIERAFELGGDAWIPWVIAIPTLGALAAGIALTYVPGARGSGIPQVKVAYASKRMKLRVRDSLAKFFICTLQIGSGSSMGREGPTVQICAGVAKAMGRLAGVSAHNLKLLLPVGAAAGIAAAFNAPIAAVTFTIEEIVGKLDQTLLSGVIVAAALAAVVERSILGENPVIPTPPGFGLDHASSLLLYAALGIAAALLSVAFTDAILRLRARFRASRLPPWLQPALGGLITGLVAAGVALWRQVGGITGGGYPLLVGALSGNFLVDTLLVLCVCKLIATVCSYASGGAGGVFAPTLALGALLGGAFGALDVELFGHGANEMGAFALVGMGAVFAGVIRAPITSVLIILEMTGGYGLTLPLMIANMLAYGLAHHLRPTQIYEALLAQDGIVLHEATPAADALDGLTIDCLVRPDRRAHGDARDGLETRDLVAGRAGSTAPDGRDARAGRAAGDAHDALDGRGARAAHAGRDAHAAHAAFDGRDVRAAGNAHDAVDGRDPRDAHAAHYGRAADNADDAFDGRDARDAGNAHDEVDALETRYLTLAPDDHPERMLDVLARAGRQALFPVVDAGGVLVGVLSLDDLTVLAAQTDLDELVRAADLMRPAFSVARTDTLGRALSMMNAHGTRELPVVDAEHRVLGLLDEAAIAHAYLRARAAMAADPTTSAAHPRIL